MQVSGLLTSHVCWLQCVTPESNYECQTTRQLLPLANWGLTKETVDTPEMLNISTYWIAPELAFSFIITVIMIKELMCVISTGRSMPAAVSYESQLGKLMTQKWSRLLRNTQ